MLLKAGAEIYQRYLKLKAKLMGLPVLGNHDIVAPLPGMPELKFSFQSSARINH